MANGLSGSIPLVIAFNDPMREWAPIRAELDAALARVLDSGWLVLGDELSGFEDEFATFLGGGHVAGVANGTDALELALRAIDIGPGDTVITVANAGGYAGTAIRACGAQPVAVDVDPDSGLVGPEHLDGEHTATARAIIITHLYGQMADMPALTEWARSSGTIIVEDCAQAHGARLNGRAAGAWGDIAAFSFYPTKNLGALGDAGAVYSNDSSLIERVRRLRQYGWGDKYVHELTGGRNSRLDEIQAACLRARLPRLEIGNRRRRKIGRRYQGEINNPLITVPHRRGDGSDVFHLFPVLCEQRQTLMEHLSRENIQTAIHYPLPDYLQPAWKDLDNTPKLPHTEKRAAEILSLPLNGALTDPEIDHVIDACNRFQA
jgi:dTDP-3-amino-2,3,6-trideoxy-4-keto-D-glucose/dTDP-3-amino-3,4,6-trideoxy-alpha-D-glucose/dTDP-2,6-dideoxy-D-kanosamine transaminase